MSITLARFEAVMWQGHFAELTGKKAVVTGASSGIGRAIARELARAGASVVIHYGHNHDGANHLIAEISSHGGVATLLQADFSEPDACEKLMNHAWYDQSQVDIWVNNAGADVLTGAATEWNYAEKLQALWEIDVRSTVTLSRLVGERMKNRDDVESGPKGVIINLGWDQADRGMAGESGELFATAKNAVMGFSRSLAVSLAPEVRVNCIAPGWIRTAWGEQAGPAWQERVLQETPLKRWGNPEDVAHLVRFLVSNEASYLTGQVIYANGGAVR
ncbi:MAG: SDR family oxidoreductase [Planctomycetaceae bacterium]